MSTGVINIEVRVDDSGAVKIRELGQTAKKAGDTGKRGMAEMEGGLQGVGRQSGVTLGALTRLGGVLAGALSVGKIVGTARAFLEQADAMAKLSQSTGVTVETLAAYQHVAALSGTSIQNLSGSLNILNRNIMDAARGTGEAQAAFRLLGISLQDAQGDLRDADSVMLAVADKMAGIEDGSAKSALAMRIFGRSGADLIPMLNAGADGIQAMKDEAERLGLVLDTQTAQQVERFNDQMTRVSGLLTGASRQIMMEMMPTLEHLANSFVDSDTAARDLGGAAEFLSNMLKLLTSSGVLVASVFESVGNMIGAVAAAILSVAQGEFRQAWDILKMGATDSVKIMEEKWAQIENIWDSNAAAALRAANATTEAGESAKKTSINIGDLEDNTTKATGKTDDYARAVQALDDEWAKLTMTAEDYAELQVWNWYAQEREALGGTIPVLEDVLALKLALIDADRIAATVPPDHWMAIEGARKESEKRSAEERIKIKQEWARKAQEINEQVTANRLANLSLEVEGRRQAGADAVQLAIWEADQLDRIYRDELANRKRLAGDFNTFFRASLAEKLADYRTHDQRQQALYEESWQAFADLADGALDTVGQLFKSVFSDAIRGELKSFEDYWKSFMNSLLNIFTNWLAEMAAAWAKRQFLNALAGTEFGQSLGMTAGGSGTGGGSGLETVVAGGKWIYDYATKRNVYVPSTAYSGTVTGPTGATYNTGGEWGRSPHGNPSGAGLPTSAPPAWANWGAGAAGGMVGGYVGGRIGYEVGGQTGGMIGSIGGSWAGKKAGQYLLAEAMKYYAAQTTATTAAPVVAQTVAPAAAPAGGSSGALGGVGVAAIVAAAIIVQSYLTTQNDRVFEGQRTGDAWSGNFATEPWMAYLGNKWGMDATAGEKFDAAVKNKDMGLMFRRSFAAADYWADPIGNHGNMALRKLGVSESAMNLIDPGRAIMNWFGSGDDAPLRAQYKATAGGGITDQAGDFEHFQHLAETRLEHISKAFKDAGEAWGVDISNIGMEITQTSYDVLGSSIQFIDDMGNALVEQASGAINDNAFGGLGEGITEEMRNATAAELSAMGAVITASLQEIHPAIRAEMDAIKLYTTNTTNTVRDGFETSFTTIQHLTQEQAEEIATSVQGWAASWGQMTVDTNLAIANFTGQSDYYAQFVDEMVVLGQNLAATGETIGENFNTVMSGILTDSETIPGKITDIFNSQPIKDFEAAMAEVDALYQSGAISAEAYAEMQLQLIDAHDSAIEPMVRMNSLMSEGSDGMLGLNERYAQQSEALEDHREILEQVRDGTLTYDEAMTQLSESTDELTGMERSLTGSREESIGVTGSFAERTDELSTAMDIAGQHAAGAEGQLDGLGSAAQQAGRDAESAGRQMSSAFRNMMSSSSERAGGMAAGGWVGGAWNGRSGLDGDTIPAILTPGEAVIPRDQAQRHAGLINAMIDGRLVYAAGGVRASGGPVGGGLGGAGAGVGDPFSELMKKFEELAKAFDKMSDDSLGKLLSQWEKLANLIGKSELSLAILAEKRALELKGMSESEQALQKQINALEDAKRKEDQRTESLRRILAVTGDYNLAQKLLTEARKKELDALDEESRALRKKVHEQEDARKKQDTLLESMRRLAAVTGDYTLQQKIMTEERKRELAALSPAEQALRKQVHAAEDARRKQDTLLESMNRIAAVTGDYALQQKILAEERKRELAALDPAAKATRERVHAMEDEYKKQQERLGLWERMAQLTGNQELAEHLLAQRRAEELKRLHPNNRALAERIHKLEDEEKRIAKLNQTLNMQKQIADMIGNENLSRQITLKLRALELAKMDKEHQYFQRLIWDLEDFASATQKAAQAAQEAYQAAQDAHQAQVQARQSWESAANAYLQGLQQELAALQQAYDQALSDYGNVLRMALQELTQDFEKAKQNYIRLLNEEMRALRSLSQALATVINQISAFRREMWTSQQSPLNAYDQLQMRRGNLDQTFNAAFGGDQDAMGRLVGESSAYLDALKSTETDWISYAREFAKVSTRLADAQEYAQEEKTDAERMIEELEKVVQHTSGTEDNVDDMDKARAAYEDLRKRLDENWFEKELERLGMVDLGVADLLQVQNTYNEAKKKLDQSNHAAEIQRLEGILGATKRMAQLFAEFMAQGGYNVPADPGTGPTQPTNPAPTATWRDMVTAKVIDRRYSNVSFASETYTDRWNATRTAHGNHAALLAQYGGKLPDLFVHLGNMLKNSLGMSGDALALGRQYYEDVQWMYRTLPMFGASKFATGGISTGPTSGYLAELHGTEAVVPLPNGRSIPVDFNSGEMVAELRALRAEVKEMKVEQRNTIRHTERTASLLRRWDDGEAMRTREEAPA